jgi:hypothetical protein
LVGDLNAKHLSWNSKVSNPSGKKLLQLFDTNYIEISAQQCPTYYTLVGNGDVLDNVVHKNIRISNVFDILGSDPLPIVFYTMDPVRTTKVLEPIEKFTDWERFQSLTTKLLSSRFKINSGVEADKVAHAFTASLLLRVSAVDE